MIEINLLPEAMRKKKVTRIAMPELPIKKGLIVIGSILLVGQLLATVVAVWISSENILSKQTISSLTESTKQAVEMKKKTSSLQGRIGEFRKMSARPFRWAVLLNVLSESVTKGIWYRDLKIDDQIISVAAAEPPAEKKGSKSSKSSDRRLSLAPKTKTVRVMKIEGSVVAAGQEPAYVGKFLKSLKDHPDFGKIFSGAELSGMSQRKIQSYEVYDFVISCTFKAEAAS